MAQDLCGINSCGQNAESLEARFASLFVGLYVDSSWDLGRQSMFRLNLSDSLPATMRDLKIGILLPTKGSTENPTQGGPRGSLRGPWGH